MKQTTAQRFKEALQRIAAGEVDAAGIAAEALRNHRIRLGPRALGPLHVPRTELQRQQGEKDLQVLRRFIAAGIPRYADFARELGWRVHRVQRRLYRAGVYVCEWEGEDGGKAEVDERTRRVARLLWEAWNWRLYPHMRLTRKAMQEAAASELAPRAG